MKGLRRMLCILLVISLCISPVQFLADKLDAQAGYYLTEKWDYTDYATENGVYSKLGNEKDGYQHVEARQDLADWVSNSVLNCYTGEGQKAKLFASNFPYYRNGEKLEKPVVFRADEEHPWQAGAGIELRVLSQWEATGRMLSVEFGVSKGAPRTWKLQYSLDDGATWHDSDYEPVTVEDKVVRMYMKRLYLPYDYNSEEYEQLKKYGSHNPGYDYEPLDHPYRVRMTAVDDGSGWIGSEKGQFCLKEIRLESGYSEVGVADPIYKCEVTVSPQEVFYNGEEQRPAVTVKYKDYYLEEGELKFTERILEEDRDYALEYRDNVNVGTGKVIIYGEGDYRGTVEREFTIRQPSQPNKPNKPSQEITGREVYKKDCKSRSFSLDIKRKAGDGKLTYKSSDSKVAAVNQNGKVSVKGPGSAVITVHALGTENYQEADFRATVLVSPGQQAIKGIKSTKAGKITVRWKRDAKAAGYQVQYGTDKNFKKNVKTIKVKGSKAISKTTPKLKKGKTYYVRVRAYKTAEKDGKKQELYGKWSKSVKSRISKK